jgi:hypothetical protein
MVKTLTPEQLIIEVNKAVKIEDLIKISSDFKNEFRSLISLIHPDICHLPGAEEATRKLNILKDKYEKGEIYHDEVAEFSTNGYTTIYSADRIILANNHNNYQALVHAAKGMAPHLLNYLPKDMTLTDDGLVVSSSDRHIPIGKMQLPQEHVNWVLSRLLEFSMMCNKCGFSHCGLNPESVFLVPETHGIVINSFYHLSRIDQKVQTIAAAYKNWYPAKLFVDKIATSSIDLELSKKMAINLLGDRSGSGIKLKKDHNESWIDYVIQQDDDPIQSYDNYRRILKQQFETKFFILNI